MQCIPFDTFYSSKSWILMKLLVERCIVWRIWTINTLVTLLVINAEHNVPYLSSCSQHFAMIYGYVQNTGWIITLMVLSTFQIQKDPITFNAISNPSNLKKNVLCEHTVQMMKTHKCLNLVWYRGGDISTKKYVQKIKLIACIKFAFKGLRIGADKSFCDVYFH